jgi:hypothetical protein
VRSVVSVTLWLGRKMGRFSSGACRFELVYDALVVEGTGKGWWINRGSMPCLYVQGVTLVRACTARNAVPTLGCSRRVDHAADRRDGTAF